MSGWGWTITFNVTCCVGRVLSAPEVFGQSADQLQVFFNFGIESDSTFGMPALREAELEVFVGGGRAQWALRSVSAGARVLVKGRLAGLRDLHGLAYRTVLVADWVEIVRGGK